MRRHVLHRLRRREVIRELRALGLLACDDRGPPLAAIPHQLAQLPNELGVLREAFDEDGPGALECGCRIGHAFLDIDERRGGRLGHERRILEQRERQRLEPGLARDLSLGAPLRFVRQVEIFESGLRLGVRDRRGEPGRHLALLLDAGDDGRTTVLELPEVAEALFERAQLGVVEPARGLLAVTRDERHGGLLVEQLDGGIHLGDAGIEDRGDAFGD